MSEIKPCPHCESEADEQTAKGPTGERYRWVQCSKCGAKPHMILGVAIAVNQAWRLLNPADIARALSEAQRRLITAASTIYGRGRLEVSRYHVSGRRVSTLTFRTLGRLRLIERWPPFLTPLGLAVRDYLLHRPTSDASTDRNQAKVVRCGKGIE